jgi:hypothetical protein
MPHKFAIGGNVEFHPATGRAVDAECGPYVISRTPRQVFSTGSNIRPSRMSASPGEASGAGPDPLLQDPPRRHRPNSDMVPMRVTRRTIPD